MIGRPNKIVRNSSISGALALAIVLTTLPALEAKAVKMNKAYSYAAISSAGNEGIAKFCP